MMIAQQLYEGVELPGEGAVGLITYMRTDSTRVSEQALDRSARSSSPARSAPTTCPRSRTSTRRSPTRRTRTKRSVRPRCSTTPTRCARSSRRDQYYLYKLDLEPVRRVADAAGDVRRDDGRHHRRRTICSASRDRCRSSPGWMAVYDQPTAAAARARSGRTAPGPTRSRPKTTRTSSAAAGAGQGRRAHAARAEAGAEVHAAAAALHRSDAGEGARRERHRPSEHLRVDHHA